MDSRVGARVGFVVALGLALFGAGWWFLSHGLYNWTHYTLTVTFDDARGLLRQTPVRMSGVTVGEVKSIELSRDPARGIRPVVTLAIDRKYEGQIPHDSTITITSGLLISNPQIEIVPGHEQVAMRDGEVWPPGQVSAPAGGLAQISPEADQAVKELNNTLREMTPQLKMAMTRVQGILKRTESSMANLDAATGSFRDLIGDPSLRRTMRVSLANVEQMSTDARRTAASLEADLRGIVKRNGGKFDELANNAIDILSKLGDTVDAARGAVTRLTEQVSDPRLQRSLVETLDLAKETVARFNQIASDIHQLTGDPTVQTDLRTAVANLKETTDQAKPLVERLNTLMGALTPTKRPSLGIGAPEIAVDFLARGDAPHFRSDVNLRVPIGKQSAFNFGIYDFAEHYKLNAQAETDVSGLGGLRYGVYASKLGVGLSTPGPSGTRLRFDAWDPNSPRLDARAIFKLNPDFSLSIGADSLFKRTTPVFGLRLTR